MKKILLLILIASCTRQPADLSSANKLYHCWANIPTTGAMITKDTTAIPEYLYDADGNKGLCNCEVK